METESGTRALKDGTVLDGVRSLRWPARRRAPGGLAGDHLSRVLGASAEFTEYRVYRQGDDPSRIDWKLLGRTDRAFIRLSNDRTILPTTLVVDASASLAYPSATLEKWHFARHVAIGLAAVALRGGDPVGLVACTANGVRRLPQRTRRGTTQDIARTLADIQPEGSPELAPGLLMARRPGRIAIVSDFLGDADETLRVAGQLSAQGREVHAIHIIHAHELDPPRRSSLFIDPEQVDLKRPMTERARGRYTSAFGNWREDLALRWLGLGAFYYQLVTSEPVARAVRRIVTAHSSKGGQRTVGS